MPIRVELMVEACEDLTRYATSGNLPLFLKKLLRLEEVDQDAGLPLGRGLTGWRKIVVGDRDWRIIVTTNAAETVATVLRSAITTPPATRRLSVGLRPSVLTARKRS